MERPKVSVIIPVYNTQKYLRQCLDSIVGQTLREIEVICVNDGSTDDSLEILKDYAARDPRVKIVSKSNLGYGHTMNTGILNASGEYVGFMESDDFADPSMYERLYTEAVRARVDIIKANYCEISGENGENADPKDLTTPDRYNKVFSPRDQTWVFYAAMMNPVGLFRHAFLTENNILHNETPGASHQDMGFWFQTMCLAQRVLFIGDYLYMYRQDNPNSSINQKNKVFAVSNEYQFIFRFLEQRPDIKSWALPIYCHRLAGSYFYRYDMLAPEFHLMFLQRFSEEMNRAQRRGDLDTSLFTTREKKDLELIMRDPAAFWRLTDGENCCLPKEEQSMEALKSQINAYEAQIVRLESRLQQGGVAPAQGDSSLISVIVPVYNTEAYLGACLDSLLNQTYRSIEVICVDDGSTDGSPRILQQYAEKDPRVKVLTQPNMGQGTARNQGLRQAGGKYVYFMDSDDLLAPNALQLCYEAAEQELLDVLYFDAASIFETPELREQNTTYETYYTRPREYGETVSGPELFCRMEADGAYRVSPCLQFLNRAFLLENAISYPAGIVHEDNVFAMKVILCAARASHRKAALFTRRVRASSTMTGTKHFKHFYGYFICCLELQTFLYGKTYPDEVWRAVLRQWKMLFQNTISHYRQLTVEEQEQIAALPPFQYEMFMRFYLPYSYPVGGRELQEIKESTSYRVGRAVTWLPRTLAGGLRCCRDHGLFYTLGLALGRLTHRGAEKDSE